MEEMPHSRGEHLWAALRDSTHLVGVGRELKAKVVSDF